MCQNLSPIGLLVYKLQLFKWSYCCNFQNNGKIWILCVDKALLSDKKNTDQAKEWLDKCYLDSALLEKKWLRGGKLTLNMVVQTQMMLNTQITQIQQLSWKTPKNFTNSSWLIINWSWVRLQRGWRYQKAVYSPFCMNICQ